MFKRVELLFPECAVPLDPVAGVTERRRNKPALANAADFARDHEPRLLKHPHMLEERGKRHRMISGERANTGIAA